MFSKLVSAAKTFTTRSAVQPQHYYRVKIGLR